MVVHNDNHDLEPFILFTANLDNPIKFKVNPVKYYVHNPSAYASRQVLVDEHTSISQKIPKQLKITPKKDTNLL